MGNKMRNCGRVLSSKSYKQPCTEQAMTDAQSITWQDIPITRVGPKRVSWSKNLLDIRNISPRVNTQRFRFPAQPTQAGPACRAGQPCRQAVSTKLHCSPQLQKVVLQAVKQFPNQKENAKYEWAGKHDNKTAHSSPTSNFRRGTIV